jgi:hypothetical protein
MMEVGSGFGMNCPVGAPPAGAQMQYFDFLNTWHVRPILDSTIIS